MQDRKDYVTTMWLCKPNLETSQLELNLPSISYQFGSPVSQSKARESALQTATASRPLQPGTIHILCQHIDWAGSENGDFCWFSVLYICWHRGWVGQKKVQKCADVIYGWSHLQSTSLHVPSLFSITQSSPLAPLLSGWFDAQFV